jgi:ABC-type molybdate transport system ATPase subunit
VAIRPESIALCAADAPDDGSANRVRATLATVRDRGRHMLLALEGDIALTVSLTPQAFHALAVSVGDEVWAVIPPEAVHMMASDGD